MDDSLSKDVRPNTSMDDRFVSLARYARDGIGCDGILFTCSAFGAAIEAAKRDVVEIPVLKPNEAMMEEAVELSAGQSPIVVLSMFQPTLPSIVREMEALAGHPLNLKTLFVEDAMAALDAGRERDCVDIIARAAEVAVSEAREQGEELACVVFAMFSMARAKETTEMLLRQLPGETPTVLTSPDTAVLRMKSLLRH